MSESEIRYFPGDIVETVATYYGYNEVSRDGTHAEEWGYDSTLDWGLHYSMGASAGEQARLRGEVATGPDGRLYVRNIQQLGPFVLPPRIQPPPVPRERPLESFALTHPRHKADGGELLIYGEREGTREVLEIVVGRRDGKLTYGIEPWVFVKCWRLVVLAWRPATPMGAYGLRLEDVTLKLLDMTGPSAEPS